MDSRPFCQYSRAIQDLSIQSKVSEGTKFEEYLPASPTVEVKTLHVSHDLGNGELVLVVDDEDSIRQITKSTLETFGYQVLLAGDGSEAVAVYASNRDDVKVVITDMMMPFMDGLATIRALGKLTPELKIICASGVNDYVSPVEALSLGRRDTARSRDSYLARYQALWFIMPNVQLRSYVSARRIDDLSGPTRRCLSVLGRWDSS